MASSPVGRQSLYSDSRDYPGCMGGLMHLFDFNQALAGRKMLTDKKFEPEQGETTYLDSRGSTSEVPKRHAKGSEEVLVVMPRSKYGHELRRPSGSRKSNGMPIRALIAQDLTKELDNKNRSPSVVARLMGLEALPEDFRAPSKRAAGSVSGTADQYFMQRPIFERQSHEESAMHRAKMYTKKPKASTIFSQITPKSSHSSRAGSSHVRNQVSESPHSKSHTQKQQLQEFKKEFEAWQTQKPWNDSKRSSKLEDTQVCIPRHQGPSNQNVNIRDEILYESKEFQDALDFLQSNKEFFMRFLHEPNSLFARHLHENELESPVETTKGIKHRERRQSLDSIESPRHASSTRKSPSSRHLESIDRRDDSRPLSWSHESPLPRSLQVPELIERTTSDFPHSPMANSDELSRVPNYRSYPISRMSSQNRAPHPDCQVPTRIVVLKPSPGRVRNINSTTSGYVRSSNDHSSFDAKEDNTDVLERLREKLRKDSSSERKKAEQKNGMLHFNEQYRDSPKDPREIAREIARQVRENITREFMAEPSLVQSGVRKKTMGRKQSQLADHQGNASFVGDPQDLTKRVNWDSHNKTSRSSLQPDKIFGFEVMQSTLNQTAEMSEQVKNQVSDSSQVHDFGMKNISIERNNSHRASQCQFSPGLSNSRWSCQFATEGSFLSQPSEGSMSPNCAVQSKDALSVDFASKIKQNDLVEQSKVGHSEALPPPPSEEAKYEPGTQVHEITERVGSEIAALNEAEKSMLHKSNSIDLTIVNADLVDHNSLATTEVEQSNAMEEEPDGPQHCDEMSNMARKQQIGGADECPVIDTFWADCTRIEQLEHGKGHDVDCFNEAQSLEIEQMPIIDKNGYAFDSNQALVPSRNECQVHMAHLDELPVHSSAISFSTGDLDINVEPVKEQGLDYMPAHSSAISSSTGGLDIDVEPVKEQLEQPSPVSVLDLPDQEDSLAATEYKELSSDLAELRMRLHFLSPDTDNIEGLESDIDNGSQLENICGIMRDDIDYMQMDDNNFDGNARFNVADWKGENSERCYVRDLLFASGLLGDSSSVLTHWYAPGQPLNPCLYQKLEKACLNGGQEELPDVKPMSKATEGVIVASRRHLLFDCANEVLLDALGSYVNKHMWSCLKVSPSMPTGKDLMELVWGRVLCSLCSHSRCQETLENLVARDLGNHSGWLDIGAQVEARGFDVERAILDDLIEETLLVL